MKETPTEFTKVEKPFIEQLLAMGLWQYLDGNTEGHLHDVARTERDSFREVLLKGRLRDAIRRINTDEDGQPWLDDDRIGEAVSRLERLHAPSPMEANKEATALLQHGTTVPGDPEKHLGRDQTVHYIDYDTPENNDFLVINQFRVDPPGSSGSADFIIPDLVLFVNGIPLVVVECKNPTRGETPLQSAITDLRKYSNQRDEVDGREGAERLFHYNQFMVATTWYEARAGTIGASYDHFKAWKDTAPVPQEQVAADLGVDHLTSQQMLVAGMLRPAHLLDILRVFTLYKESGSETVKIIPRYQQFRAVQAAIKRLRTGQTREEHGERDQRGGIIWHTQGSGKSLTMVFLIRAMRTLKDLRRFKVVIVTDRQDLEKQLSETAALTGETVRIAESTADLKSIVSEPGPDLVFAMIQKYQEHDEAEVIEFPTPDDSQPAKRVAEDGPAYGDDETVRVPGQEAEFEELNPSPYILVLVDEAHRSHDQFLHANLMRALPNCAKIAFTGTPIIEGKKKRTHEIFGPFIDTYTIKQSEADGMTVPIKYEGRTTHGTVSDEGGLDRVFEDMFHDHSEEEREAIKARYATRGKVLEARQMIRAKARDMLRHYVRKIMPEGFKAQVVAVSRRAVVRYQQELTRARDELIERLEALDAELLTLSDVALQERDPETQLLVEAHGYLDTIRRLEFAAVISSDKKDPQSWKRWTRKRNTTTYIERFKQPLYGEPAQRDGMAFLCVNSMLITGFDAPLEQVLYLDRNLQSYQLLQAIARVNRTADGKERGYVVDYYGVVQHLKEALDVYTEEDVEGALTSLKDELPLLRDRHQRVLNLFYDRGIDDISDVDACVHLLRDERLRAEFVMLLRNFLTSLNIVMPAPEALTYRRDAKLLGFINKAAQNLYRDDQLSIAGVGHKVRKLIDDHIEVEAPELKIPPVTITDADFDDVVEQRGSPRTKASEMEHALRYHIRQHYQEDPVYYRKLSERLEAILEQFEDNWEALVEALRPVVRDARERTERPEDETGLDPVTQAPFLRVLVEEAGGRETLSDEELHELAEVTVELVDELIRPEVQHVDFWRKATRQDALAKRIFVFLDRHSVIDDVERLPAIADEIVDVARANRERFRA